MVLQDRRAFKMYRAVRGFRQGMKDSVGKRRQQWCAGRTAVMVLQESSTNGMNSSDGAGGKTERMPTMMMELDAVRNEDASRSKERKCSASLRIVTPTTSSFVVATSTLRMVLEVRSPICLQLKGNL
jgi:hypothetical protein